MPAADVQLCCTFAAMRPGDPILIVSHTFPPFRGIGGRRWAKLAKELARRGHAVHVVHADQGPDLKGSLWSNDVLQPGITTHTLPSRYPAVLMKRPLTSPIEKLAYRFWLKVLPWLVEGNIFDRSVRWGPVLLPMCDRLIAAHGIKHVIASAPPFAMLHQLLGLKRRQQVQLIADFRDPWTWGEVYGQSAMSALRKSVEDRLEAEVIAGYDAIVTPSPFILEHLRTAYPVHAAKMALLDHVIDPDELVPVTTMPTDGHFRLIYAGSIYNATGFQAYLEELLKAFAHVRHLDEARWRLLKLDLYITGHGTLELERRVAAAGQQERITFHAPLPAAALSACMAQADLVIAYMPPEKRDFVSTKFNEIAFLRKPLLHIGEPGGLSEHIVSHGLGASLRVDEVAERLPEILSGERRIVNEGRFNVDKHTLRAVAERLLKDVLR